MLLLLSDLLLLLLLRFLLLVFQCQTHLQVFVVDFGFASHVPTKERANLDQNYGHMAFGGTPDYASRDALRGLRSSRKVTADMPPACKTATIAFAGCM